MQFYHCNKRHLIQRFCNCTWCMSINRDFVTSFFVEIIHSLIIIDMFVYYCSSIRLQRVWHKHRYAVFIHRTNYTIYYDWHSWFRALQMYFIFCLWINKNLSILKVSLSSLPLGRSIYHVFTLFSQDCSCAPHPKIEYIGMGLCYTVCDVSVLSITLVSVSELYNWAISVGSWGCLRTAQ